MLSKRHIGNKSGRRALSVVAATFLALVLTLVAGCGSATNTDALSSQAAATSAFALPRSEPASVEIPSIGAKSSLIPLGLDDKKAIQVPPVSQPMQAGWYTNGPTPGELGPAVILGHVDGGGHEGIFFRLHEMKKGDQVSVVRKDNTVAKFVVDHVDTVAKDQFPTQKVYGDTSDAELRLITCGGAFDKNAHNYVDNVIVYATLSKS